MIKRLVVTGYKAHELGIFNEKKHPGFPYIKRALEQRLRVLIDEGLEWVIISGQLGVELWTAEIVLELKQEFPDIKLAVLTPFLNQEQNWKEEKQEYYRGIVNQVDYVNSITKREYEGPWQFKAKTEFLLDNSDALLLLYDDEKEGSPKFLLEEAKKRAEKEGYEYMQITSYDLQLLVEEDSFHS
ncbi:DUF1273 domain-containing protein [Bacillus horti]|uniref:UPF0398 protein J2S11_001740 n=1 Tax=Caldalkalibacillus horti TaxID=77523 RepID=A0ABT9VXZ7_9BACI|nr:DUF1273 domain-containing protein [Bacillus horti]MDQ0165839.1 putative phage-like protein YoqJ [Bacillus horti]